MKQINIISYVALLVIIAVKVQAQVIDLGHPTLSTFTSTAIASNGDDRNIVFDADTFFSISSAGILIDPLAGGASEVKVEIYDMALTGGVGSRNSLLASASTTIADLGQQFYDIPINFSFNSGTRYNVAFNSGVPAGWGFGINNMEFYFFDFPDTSYSKDGLVTVIDGGQGVGLNGGFGNSVMPHVRLDTSIIPEPSEFTILTGSLVLILAVRRWKK